MVMAYFYLCFVRCAVRVRKAKSKQGGGGRAGKLSETISVTLYMRLKRLTGRLINKRFLSGSQTQNLK